MDLSADLQRRLDTLASERDSYAYGGNLLADKISIPLMAPTAVGKTTLANECLRQCIERGIDAGEGGTTTTRDRREGDDPPNFITATEGVTFESMITQIENKELINWSMHGTGNLYGSTADANMHKYIFAPMMPDSLGMVQRAGFERVVAIYLVIPREQWRLQLAERLTDPKFVGRMHEAISSLDFAQANADKMIFLNIGHGEQAVRERAASVIDYITGIAPLESDPDAPQLISEMRAFAQEVIDGNT